MIKKLYHRLFRGNGYELSIDDRKETKKRRGDIFDVLSDKEKNKEEKNIHGLSKEEITAILQDMLFYNKISDGSYLYAWDNHDVQGVENGSAKFSAIARSPLYNKNINKNEEILYEDRELDSIIGEISKNKTTHIELGPESGEKFVKYADQWDPDYWHLKGKKYIGVDVSGVYVDMANKNVKKIGMVAESVPGDRFEHSVFDTEKNQIYYFLGGSICNLDVGNRPDQKYPDKKKTIINLLKRMRSNDILSSVPVVLTYFEAPDKNDPEYEDKVDQLKATYGSKENEKYYDEETHNAVSDFILSGLEESLGLDRSKLEFLVEYDDQNSPAMIKLGAKFIEKTEIPVGYNKVVKSVGEKIRAIKSQRFTKEEFAAIAKDADFTIKYQKSRNGVVVAILQSKLGGNDKFKKTRNIAYGILIGATLLGGGLLTKNILHQKEIQQEKDRTDTEFVNKQKLSFYGGQSYYEMTEAADKIEYINKLTTTIFENITLRYNIQTDEDEIKKIIRSYIKDKEILEGFANGDNYNYNVFNVSDAFVKKYSDILIEKDINKMPYDHLKEYEEYFKDLIVDPNMANDAVVQIHKGPSGGSFRNGYLLSPKDMSMYFDIQLECVKGGVKRELIEEKEMPANGENDLTIKLHLSQRRNVVSYRVKDGYVYVKKWVENPYSYVVATSQDGEERKNIDATMIAYDYFYQNRPIIHEVYKKFGAIYRDMSSNDDRETDQTCRWKKDSVKIMITKDLLQTGFLDKISLNNERAILVYLQGFAKRNAVALQKDGISLSPYATYLKDHGEAFENTENVNEKDVPDIIKYEGRREEYNFRYMGKYYAQEGTEYDLAEVMIKGKKYLYARNSKEDAMEFHSEEGMNIINTDYYLKRGKEVAKDYSNLKKKIQ